MKGHMTIGAKIIIGIIILAIVYFAANTFLPKEKIWQALVPQKANIAQVEELAGNNATVPLLPFPSGSPITTGIAIRMNIWAWNTHIGLILANGGSETTDGGIMAKHHVRLSLIRQDDAGQMQNNLMAFANELAKGNPQPSGGVHFVTIMGDGAAAFLQGINPNLAKLGPDYTAEAIASWGYSWGEDKLMGPSEWKSNPQSMKGGVISGYLRDGDWNIAMKFMADNGIPNNPDPTTYDPNAVNWVAADDYIDAGKKYISSVYSEERSEIRDGKKTGKKVKIGVGGVPINGVVTWTPGDVNVAREKGGLVSIVSTKEYRWQMPNTLIGIKKWDSENRDLVENMLAAGFEGADQIKCHDEALHKAASLSAQVYGEQTPDYWYKYFKGVTERDITGLTVELGGSRVNNAADNMYLFGLLPGSMNIFAATYNTFGDIVKQQYPDLVPTYPPVNEILNTSYVRNVANRSTSTVQPDVVTYSTSQRMTQQVSKRNWTINFQSGSAQFTFEAERTLEELANSLAIGGLLIEVDGHTDSQGNPESNQTLSENRAFAVQQWLIRKSPTNFKDRVRVRAFGQTVPIASNETAEGRAKNRRVEIIQGQ